MGVVVGDTGTFTGTTVINNEDTTVALAFTVGQILDDLNFGIYTKNVLQSGWPSSGTIVWLSGANESTDTTVLSMVPANAYITETYLNSYLASRNRALALSLTATQYQGAIVQATDYLDQRYRYKGVKLLQFCATDPDTFVFVDPYFSAWIFPYSSFLSSSYTQQHTEWPRQGCVDYNGDMVYGVPTPIERACAELASRQLLGTVLQPDYDPNVVANGAVIETVTENVGPIQTTTTYDTKFGLGFFPDFPQVKRILQTAGLLVSSGGRMVMR
jgi:hypothetical protein